MESINSANVSPSYQRGLPGQAPARWGPQSRTFAGCASTAPRLVGRAPRRHPTSHGRRTHTDRAIRSATASSLPGDCHSLGFSKLLAAKLSAGVLALARHEAAAHPAHVSYLYYVAAPDGCGAHVFSRSYARFRADAAAYQGLE